MLGGTKLNLLQTLRNGESAADERSCVSFNKMCTTCAISPELRGEKIPLPCANNPSGAFASPKQPRRCLRVGVLAQGGGPQTKRKR